MLFVVQQQHVLVLPRVNNSKDDEGEGVETEKRSYPICFETTTKASHRSTTEILFIAMSSLFLYVLLHLVGFL